MPPASPSVHPNECILRSITARSLAIDPLAIRSLLRPALCVTPIRLLSGSSPRRSQSLDLGRGRSGGTGCERQPSKWFNLVLHI